MISNFTAGYMSEENEDISVKRYVHPMFITALFTIAKIWKQPKWLSTDEYKEDVNRWYIMYNEILLGNKPVFILKQYVIWSCWI